MVGCWKINNTKFEKVAFTLDKYSAGSELCRDGVMVTSTNLDESNTLYNIIEQRIIAKDDVCIPLYDQI